MLAQLDTEQRDFYARAACGMAADAALAMLLR